MSGCCVILVEGRISNRIRLACRLIVNRLLQGSRIQSMINQIRSLRLLPVALWMAVCGCNGEPRDPTAVPTLRPDASTNRPASTSQTRDVGSVARVESRLIRTRDAVHQTALDPANDGWRTEVMSEQAQTLIKQLVLASLDATSQSALKIEQLLDAEFVHMSLDKPQATIAEVPPFNVSIQNRSDDRGWRSESIQDPRRVGEIVRSLVGGAKKEDVVELETKTVRVELADLTLQTTHRVEAVVSRGNEFREYHWDWNCEWHVGEPPTDWRLRRLRTSSYVATVSAGRLFSDQTSQVFANVEAYAQQLGPGLNHWLDRIEVTHGMYVFAEYGIAVGDVNGDGYDDVYLCQPAGLPNRLLLRGSDGGVVDASHRSGTDWLDHTSSSLFVDFDNDGDQDLAIAVEAKQVIVMNNDGSGSFSVATTMPILDRHVQGLSAADYDSDGLVDLYLTVGFADTEARSTETRPAFSYHDANEGGANVLFKNASRAGGLRFVDVTKQVGLDEHNRRHSLAASWEDFDNDGDQDLYVANDYGQNCLYENTGGQFRDIAATAGVIDFGSGMSVDWCDYDHDGQMDLYVGNMYSSAGNRIARQASFQRQVTTSARELLPRFAKGNTLFQNVGNGRFRDIGSALGVEFGRWAWSSVFCDINNDGNEDLLIANGYITFDDEQDL